VLLYYAVGGGLGHATRARAFLHGNDLDGVILTSAPLPGIETLVVPDALRHDRKRYREWLRALGAERIIIDTFPAGLFHEFDDFEGTFDYVARYLTWPRYAPMLNPPRFETTYVLEPLHEDQERFIVAQSTRIDRAPKLIDPDRGVSVDRANYTLVIHSGDADEVNELIDYAQRLGDEPVLVATRSTIARTDVTVINAYPATALAERAQRIITGAGFNCMRQFGGDPRHHAIPFARRFDDQFLRAARYRSSETSIRSNCEPSILSAR
jgi:hypothetical protein